MATPIRRSPDQGASRTRAENPPPLKRRRLDFSEPTAEERTNDVFRQARELPDDDRASDFLNSRPLPRSWENADISTTSSQRTSSSRRPLFQDLSVTEEPDDASPRSTHNIPATPFRRARASASSSRRSLFQDPSVTTEPDEEFSHRANDDISTTSPRRTRARRSIWGNDAQEADGTSMLNTGDNLFRTPPRSSSATSSSSNPPDIKAARRAIRQTPLTEYGENAKKIRSQIEDLQSGNSSPFTIECMGHLIEITSVVRHLGHGHFNDAYLVEGNIVGMPEDSQFELPDQFVIKILQEHQLEEANPTVIVGHELVSQLCIQDAFNKWNGRSLRIAKSYDMELLREPAAMLHEIQGRNPHKAFEAVVRKFIKESIQHGFSLVEYVEGEEMSDHDVEEHKEELKQIIAFIYEKNLPIDFIRSNLRLETQRDGSKRIVGFDLYHPQGDRVRKEGTIKPILDSFAEKNPTLFRFLDPREQRT